MSRATDDSVPLMELVKAPEDKPKSTYPLAYNLKLLLSLFLTFLLVVSDMFNNSVISSFGEKAIVMRTPTTWGIILQGIFLVIGYAIAVYLIRQGIM